uniref:Transposase n=1 Tax=candidate division WOR-3 bacterium TaxID=2052148 RepID=A0A7C4TFR8_UNCW3
MKGIKNIRLKNYNYTSNGYYFITICTNYRRPYLIGQTKNVVAQFIEQIPSKMTGVNIDYYKIMPTHLHIILILEECKLKLGEIVRRIKATTSKQTGIHLWQPNYYEHVIRNEIALKKIREYIENNPLAEKIKFEQFYENNKL